MPANRLINEKSPYLLQHAHNPVDWYPWGEEAFAKAKKEDKPVFLSIGYSTCHWCHVMEEESFANAETAKILNENFVSIKVDREERPDIDSVYMAAVIAMGSGGGWPLSVFLTPDKKPFYGGTYFPPEDRWGMPAFPKILNLISRRWKEQREEMLKTSDAVVKAVAEQAEISAEKAINLDKAVLKNGFVAFAEDYDKIHGGFGSAPKFPRPHALSFILRYAKAASDREAMEMVKTTLTKMAGGGIYDHIGGGFHRYSTDQEWQVPHFEKMLNDQAVISRAYLEAYQATHDESFAQVSREIFEYVLRDMTSFQGGFYSAEDADSFLPEDQNRIKKKKEGAFYLWSYAELKNILAPEELEVVSFYYGIKPEGNIRYDPQGEFKEKNIFYLGRGQEDAASHFNRTLPEVEAIIKSAKEKIFAVRAKRPRPQLDDKILVDGNGLMISSLAFASRVLNEPRYLRAAEKAARFILKDMARGDGRLLHRYRDNDAAVPALLDDYAFFIHGLIDLYEASFNIEYLKQAQRLNDEMLRLFWDKDTAGFFLSGEDAEKLPLRRKELYDAAIPSGNSLAALDLIRLARLTMNKEYDQKAAAMFKIFSDKISAMPQGYPQMLNALDFALGPSQEIVIAGDSDDPEIKNMLSAIYHIFLPNKVVAFSPPSKMESRQVVPIIPFVEWQTALENAATAYVCENYVCNIPARSAEQLQQVLKK